MNIWFYKLVVTTQVHDYFIYSNYNIRDYDVFIYLILSRVFKGQIFNYLSFVSCFLHYISDKSCVLFTGENLERTT